MTRKVHVEGYTRQGPSGPVQVDGYERDDASSGALGAALHVRLDGLEEAASGLASRVADYNAHQDAGNLVIRDEYHVLAAELGRLDHDADRLGSLLVRLRSRDDRAAREAEARVLAWLEELERIRRELGEFQSVERRGLSPPGAHFIYR